MHGTITKPLPQWINSVGGREVLLCMLKGYRAMSPTEIAIDLDLDVGTFVTWFEKMRLAFEARPHAMTLARFVLDLRKLETFPAPIGPDDIQRRDASLARAAALASTMPIWPNPPVEWTPEPDARSHSGCGWTRDENGTAFRRTRALRGGNHGVSDRRHRKRRDADDDEF